MFGFCLGGGISAGGLLVLILSLLLGRIAYEFYAVKQHRMLPKWKGQPLQIYDSKQIQPIIGPESLLLRNNPADWEGDGTILSGTADGYLVETSITKQVKRDVLSPLDFYNAMKEYAAHQEKGLKMASDAMFAEHCDSRHESFVTAPQHENVCGRILGLKWLSDTKMLIVNTHLGIFSYELLEEKLELLMPVGDSLFLNDAVMIGSKIYFTDSSTMFDRPNYRDMLIIHDSTGQLKSYDTETKKTEVLLNGIPFANGICKIGHKLYVVRLLEYAITEYDLKTKQSRLVVDDLPLFPDNIRSFNQTQLIVTGFPRSPIMNLLRRLPQEILNWLLRTMKMIPGYGRYLDLLKKQMGLALVINSEDGTVTYSITDEDCSHFCGRSEAQLSPQSSDCQGIECHSMFFGTVMHQYLTEIRFKLKKK